VDHGPGAEAVLGVEEEEVLAAAARPVAGNIDISLFLIIGVFT